MKRTILIGDVHGCIDELEALLKVCGHAGTDQLVLVGDLVAKGPDSRSVVEAAISLGALAVRGNHDEHVLRWNRADPADRKPLKPDHRQVVDTLGPAQWRYLEALPYYLELPALHAVVVHAGLEPGVPLPAQQRKYLLNMRSLTPSGEPSARIGDGVPWASLWKGPETVVFGHDAVRGLQTYPLAWGLDTGCVYGRELTALLLPERRLVSVPARRAYAKVH